MEIDVKTDAPWYHVSNLVLTELRIGSTITQWKGLDKAFSHKLTSLSYDDEGVVD